MTPRPSGDPSGMRSEARRLRAIADDLRRLVQGHHPIGRESYAGDGANRMHVEVRSMLQGVEHQGSAISEIAATLEREAAMLESEQRRWDTAAARVPRSTRR